jgi:mono/diheme cytochrome c family protein
MNAPRLDLRKLFVIASVAVLVVLGAGASLIKWRGFRASSKPSAFETAVARSLRNFAIPGKERSKANPVAGDPVVLQRGREDYFARCASCHGVDAHGLTPIGANVYQAHYSRRSTETPGMATASAVPVVL